MNNTIVNNINSYNNEKFNNQLNLSIEATDMEREKSLDLGVGYNSILSIWQVIILHDGTLQEKINNNEFWENIIKDGVTIDFLNNNYGIITTPLKYLEAIGKDKSILYVEKPNRIIPYVINGKRASCISPVTIDTPLNLTGNNVLIGIIDSGIDPNLDIFFDENNNSRIEAYWDQNLIGEEAFNISNAKDLTGHGTSVAYIAASVAPNSKFVIVRLGTPIRNSFPKTTELMKAIDFCINYANNKNIPIAINLSFGNNYGSHDGQSLLETYIDSVSNIGKNVICVGTGNEGLGNNHFFGEIKNGETKRVSIDVGEFLPSFNLQIWKEYNNDIEIFIQAPNLDIVGPLKKDSFARRYMAAGTDILVFYGEPKPYTKSQEVYIDFIPLGEYLISGEWTLIINSVDSNNKNTTNIHMWLPSTVVLGNFTGFLNPSKETTLTIPSTALKVISVGAYNSFSFSYAPFSGRGYTRNIKYVKPDLVAPGVNINVKTTGNVNTTVSGTSFATPFVTAGSALLMEWGIVKGNDPYLYGEKVKAYLIKGARQLSEFEDYPNPEVGWGALCLRDSLPL